MRNSIERKIDRGERLEGGEGLYLLNSAPIHWLGRMAQIKKAQCLPSDQVTFLVDSNPNYTNVCDTDCHFCAFFRRPHDSDAYTLSVAQVMAKIERAVKKGATTILLQGGHNPSLSFDYYLDLVRETKLRFPGVTPHFFSASEIRTMASVSGLSIQDVLAQLQSAGQDTLPGGGAEILSSRVRSSISPKKGSPAEWLEVHREAHKLGFVSTATMMYGHVETADDIIQHWNCVRELQDESLSRQNGGGFTAFVPWSFKPDHSVLGRRLGQQPMGGPIKYLRLLAASRLYLDNFQHIQASWFSEGKKTGQIALSFGADDFGGTLFEENVHAEAGFVNTSTVSEVVQLIHGAGFNAAQRTTKYDLLKQFPRDPAPCSSSVF